MFEHLIFKCTLFTKLFIEILLAVSLNTQSMLVADPFKAIMSLVGIKLKSGGLVHSNVIVFMNDHSTCTFYTKMSKLPMRAPAVGIATVQEWDL